MIAPAWCVVVMAPGYASVIHEGLRWGEAEALVARLARIGVHAEAVAVGVRP